MGVPSFYRWLVRKYPKIVLDAEEGVLEIDNLYLDMNGIIHPCFHPDDDVFPPTSFDEVFSRMYEYIDRLVNIARPRKLLFMAIDGVAPRAKMNQQRARRFRSSKDNHMAEEMEEKLRQQFEKLGKALLPKQESEVSDSNVITPGTEFMHELSKKLQFYIRSRMSEDQAWCNLKVILSDDRVPGEGEHKIMSFIRAQRSLPGYDPNTKHCLYGLDADLIMLALATHEIHFSILREEVLSPIFNQHNQCSSLEHSLQKINLEKSVAGKEPSSIVNKKQHYQFLNVWVLREYLELDCCGICPDNEFDLERIVDDFIFICFFAGNDFLPHIPSLEIHEGCIDLLMHVYKHEFKNLGGYIVDIQRVDHKKGGYVKLKRVERFTLLLGAYEEKIFEKRMELRDWQLRRIIADHSNDKDDERIALDEGRSSDIVYSSVGSEMFARRASVLPNIDEAYGNTKQLKQELKDVLKKQSDVFKDGGVATDKVKFGKQGWKERYYQVKFNAQSLDEAEAIRKSVVAKYGEGLCWSLLYYFSGVPSWTWYYPYHYGPVTSDCKGLSQVKLKFERGQPFKPFDQLMGVLPPSSAHALPAAYKLLMTDKNSRIIDLYPTEFETDMDGKRFTWQGLCKLPFIEEARLLAETSKLQSELKDYEKVRNTANVNRMFLQCSNNPLGFGSCGARQAPSDKIKDAIKMELTIEGVKGFVHQVRDDIVETDGVLEGKVMCLFFEIKEESRFIPRPLGGVDFPEKTVCGEDISEMTLWHESRGRNSSCLNRPQLQMPTGQNCAMSSSLDTFRGAGRGFSSGRGQHQMPTGQICAMSGSSDMFRGAGRGFSLGRGQLQMPTGQNCAMSGSSDTFRGGAGRGFFSGRGQSHVNENEGSYQPTRQYYPSSTIPDSSGKFGGVGRGFTLGRGRLHTNEYKHDFQPFVRQTECNWGLGPASGSSKLECRGGMERPKTLGTVRNVSNTNPNSFWTTRGNLSHSNSLSHGNSNEGWRLGTPRGGIRGNGSQVIYVEGRGWRSKPIEPSLDDHQHLQERGWITDNR